MRCLPCSTNRLRSPTYGVSGDPHTHTHTLSLFLSLPSPSPDLVCAALTGVLSARRSCLAIELLTGSPPYAELPTVTALFKIVQDRHPPLPSLAAEDKDLQNFLMRCFQKEPGARPDA